MQTIYSGVGGRNIRPQNEANKSPRVRESDVYRNNKKTSYQDLTVADEFHQQESMIGNRIFKYEEITNFDKIVPQNPTVQLRKSKGHSLDSCRTEPEQMTDPPSVEIDSSTPSNLEESK